ncbi:MAG TPA: efflux transporter outer membrane subunit [Steroidobacteraceae bacterium]|nr:efflux transporter outer membrane subunit [Steroidobacteraceae bacterium]
MRRPLASLLLTLTLLSISACSFAPRDVRPDLPTDSTYPQEYVGDSSAGAQPIKLHWRDFFADPRLEAIVNTALERNRDLVISVAQIEETRGLYRIQRADQLPSVGVSGDATRTRAGPQSVPITSPTTIPSGSELTYDRYSLGLGVASFELDFWGRVRNLTTAARSEYLATVEAARAFRLSLIRDVATAYLTSLEARERLELAEATVESRREGLRIAKRRLDAGVTSALDYSQTETLLTQAETELAALRLSKAQNDNLLVALIGGPIEAGLPPPVPLAQQTRVEVLAAGIPSDLLTNRPDILAAEQRLRAARANIGAARAAFLPAISLTGTYGYASTELSELVGEDGLTWSYGPSISLPIFDFGGRRANLTVAQARENIAIADYERTIQNSFREVADALAGRRYLSERVAAQERATNAQRRLAELARTRYREGVARYIEVLDAERSLFSAEQALLQDRSAEVANLVALYVALGGGQL